MRRRNEAGPDPDRSGTVVGVGESITAHGYYPGMGRGKVRTSLRAGLALEWPEMQ